MRLQVHVVSFATELKNDGVDVVLDKWQLKEGYDTYAFMEKSATDSSITNVTIRESIKACVFSGDLLQQEKIVKG